MSSDDELREMDDAASEAYDELLQNIDRWNARDVVKWWANWYMKAGHKRLGRLLVQLSKEKDD
ncbi:MAG: hypothetical protein EPN47_18545 [Acidobacteria bacterium]|nr:MAG: hypothetical protein EPN47_18545 [Acidobacteriota bacterium]